MFSYWIVEAKFGNHALELDSILSLFIGASLSEPHTSVTALRTSACMLVRLYACLNRPLTVNFKSAHSNISRWLNVHSVKGYCQTAGSAWKRVRAKTIQVECIGSTHGNLLFEPWYDKAGCEWQSDSRVRVRWLQVRAWHACDCSYIAWIRLLAHGLTVKLSKCLCHSSLAGRIAACLCGHSKCNLLLAQARPRMIQHLTSLMVCFEAIETWSLKPLILRSDLLHSFFYWICTDAWSKLLALDLFYSACHTVFNKSWKLSLWNNANQKYRSLCIDCLQTSWSTTGTVGIWRN